MAATRANLLTHFPGRGQSPRSSLDHRRLARWNAALSVFRPFPARASQFVEAATEQRVELTPNKKMTLINSLARESAAALIQAILVWNCQTLRGWARCVGPVEALRPVILTAARGNDGQPLFDHEADAIRYPHPSVASALLHCDRDCSMARLFGFSHPMIGPASLRLVPFAR